MLGDCLNKGTEACRLIDAFVRPVSCSSDQFGKRMRGVRPKQTELNSESTRFGPPDDARKPELGSAGKVSHDDELRPGRRRGFRFNEESTHTDVRNDAVEPFS
jgi:hypothetical protein